MHICYLYGDSVVERRCVLMGSLGYGELFGHMNCFSNTY